MKQQKFIISNNSDFEHEELTRTFNGKLTKNRYKILDRFCRKNTFYRHCGCSYDCCGCVSSSSANFTYKHNIATITIVSQYNY